MATKIKVREVTKKGIKTLDKSIKELDKGKDIKDKTTELKDNNSNNTIYSYASNKVEKSSNIIGTEGVYIYNEIGKKSTIDTKNNIVKVKNKIKNYKNKKKNVSRGIKTTNKTMKTSVQTIKTANNMKKEFIRSIKTSIKGIKRTVKATVTSIKAIISGTKALIELLIAGGWVAVVIILIVCMISLLCNSVFGIFFSNEKNNGSNITMSSVITSINTELNTKIEDIKKEKIYDDYTITYNTSSWKDILIIYAVKLSNGNTNSEVMTLDDKKLSMLKSVFWDMNPISYEVVDETINDNSINGSGVSIKKILHITINGKSITEMINNYQFSPIQKTQVQDLSSSKYDSLWKGVISYSSLDSIGDYLFPVGEFYTITQYYSESHKAIDISSNYGSNIYAISDGSVYMVKGGCVVGDLSCNGKGGNYVIIKHSDNRYYSTYMHLKSYIVKVGDEVSKGQVIGYMGNTGNVIPVPTDSNSTNGTHLHFVLYDGIPYKGGNERNFLYST